MGTSFISYPPHHPPLPRPPSIGRPSGPELSLQHCGVWSLRHLLDLLVDLIDVTLAPEDADSILLILMVAVADVGAEENVDDRLVTADSLGTMKNTNNRMNKTKLIWAIK